MAKDDLKIYSGFAFRLQLLLRRCLEGKEALTDIKRAMEVFKFEQFVSCLAADIHNWIVDKKPQT